MKARPLKYVDGRLTECPVAEATHVEIKRPGPAGTVYLPILVGMSETRAGTSCWNWNGDTEKPTIKPSIATRWNYFSMDAITEDDWGPWEEKGGTKSRGIKPESRHKMKEELIRCHTWITDGKAQFLDDCTHNLRGQTLDLEDI